MNIWDLTRRTCDRVTQMSPPCDRGRRRPHRRRRRHRGLGRGLDRDRGTDRGATFIEIVVSISLLGLIVVPSMLAMTALIRSSTTSREAANVETVLLNVADRINRSESTLCDYTAFAEAAVVTHGWDVADVAVSHQYYDPVANTWQTGPAGAEACPASGDRPLLVKLVTVTVTSPQVGISRSIEVVKSDI